MLQVKMLRVFIIAVGAVSGLVPLIAMPKVQYRSEIRLMSSSQGQQSSNEEKVRRSRLYRLDEATQSLERSPRNASRVAELDSKLEKLRRKEQLGESTKAKVSKMSERVKAVNKEKFRVGDVVVGRCVELRPFGAMIDIGQGRRPSLLHKSEISQRLVRRLDEVIPLGSEITCAIVSIDQRGRISLSTKVLEKKPGDMLTDAASVFASAPKEIKIKQDVNNTQEVRRRSATQVADAVTQLATDSSLDDIENQIQRIQTNKKSKQNKKISTDKIDETLLENTNSPLDLAAAFEPVAPEVKQRQREEEFDLLMTDLVYTPASSLTDVGKIIRGRRKRGAFTSPFWTKVFPRKARKTLELEQQQLPQNEENNSTRD